MFTPRQARQGLALLSSIVCWTMSATAEPPPVQADVSVTAGEGDQDRGVAPPPRAATKGDAAPPATPQADRQNAAATPLVQGAGPTSAVDDAQVASETASRQLLNEYLVRDRAIAIQLATAVQNISAGRYDDALSALQAVCDAPSDVFVWPEDGRPPVAAQALATELFRQLPQPVLIEYERRCGADARRLLTETVRTPNLETVRELLRRYEFTRAGAQASLREAERAFDSGEFSDAARRFERYLANPLCQREANVEVRLRAEVARELAAAEDLVIELPEFDWSQPVERNGKVQTAGAWRKGLLESLHRRLPPVRTAEIDWRLALGNSQAHRPLVGSLPTLDPLWSASHDEPRAGDTAELQTVSYEATPRGSDLLEHWLATRHERRLPCAGANFALVDGERLLVRDFSGVSARDLRTGNVLWQYPCASGLLRRVEEIQAAAKAAATPPVPFDPTPLFNEYFAQNSVLGMLASDGERVYCIDLLPNAPPKAGPDSPVKTANRLVALALSDAGQPAGTPAWEVSEGWYFLGPPLPAHDRLYVIAERNSLVALLALAARTGKTLWSQPISLVDATIGDDPQRARQACSPTISGGIVVCPTQLGTIVGVDARTGSLAWVYAYSEPNGPSQPWRKSRAFDREHGTPEFPNLASIIGGAVLVLAPQSANVHCIDLQTGKQRWAPQDRDEAHYAATVGDELVLLVGPRNCVARRISDGTEVWRQPIETPTGRGLAVGNSFLLPTADGRILSLDIKTGRVAPDLLPRLERKRNVALRAADGIDLLGVAPADERVPISGNLVCSGNFIVACSPTGVAVYPQAQVVLDAIRDESRTAPLSAAGWLERGELELRLGDVAAAEQSLVSALQQNPSPRTRAVAQSRLRELLYAELSRSPDADAQLAALDGLCAEPADRARFLSERLQRELHGGDAVAACATAVEIVRLSVDYPVPMDARGEYVALPARRAAAALAQCAGAHAEGKPAALRILSEQNMARRSLSDIAAVTASSLVAPEERAARAQALIDGDQFHAAELLLLAETRLVDQDLRRPATERLAALWKQCGLNRDAQRLLDESELVVATDVRPKPVIRADIEQRIIRTESEESRAASALEELLSRNRDYGRQPPGSRVLFDRGLQGTPERYSSLSVVDTAEPRLVADLTPLPPRVWKVGDSNRYDAGHFLPVAGNGDVHGVSLLEGRIVWSAATETHRTGDKVALGPYGPEFCILQGQETVTALDPSDGRVLWRRTDIPFDAGLERDELAMFADDIALVIFNADFATYRVLDPRSGELLAHGLLEPSAEPRRRGWCFGRRLLYVNAQKSPRLRLWDPLQTEFALDVPCEGRCLVDTALGGGLAAVLNGRRLFVLETRTASIVWSTMLTEADAAAARQLRAIHEGNRFCIHVEHDVANSPSSQATHDISGVPNVPLQGTLYVIDRHSLEHWSRTVPRCNLLLFPNERLPVLVTLGRTREGETDQGTTFVMEVIDATTGVTLCKRSNLARTSKLLLHSRYDEEHRTLLLRGVDSEIAVRLER